jgi:hypothetical protein
MKIAFITSRFPFPVEKGDKLRAFHHIRWLSQTHDVYLFAVTHQTVAEEDIAVLKSICAEVSVYRISQPRLIFNVIKGWIDGFPAQVAYFLDQRQKRLMQGDLIRLGPDQSSLNWSALPNMSGSCQWQKHSIIWTCFQSAQSNALKQDGGFCGHFLHWKVDAWRNTSDPYIVTFHTI